LRSVLVYERFESLNIALGSGDDHFVIDGVVAATRLNANFGDDIVSILKGGDLQVFGGAGADFLRGSPEDDFLYGGDDNDIIIGNGGRNILIGGEGDDYVLGDIGPDLLIGDNAKLGANPWEVLALSGTGHDILIGGPESDRLYGGNGDDLLVGGSLYQPGERQGMEDSDDQLEGGDGDDTLHGDDAYVSLEFPTLSGSAWHDLNGNGIRDNGEPGRSAVIVQLFATLDGIADNGDDRLIGNVETTSTGAYNFGILPPGVYYLRFVPPQGFDFSPQHQG
jgi:Ca2+-binding RTX toxin-like protein